MDVSAVLANMQSNSALAKEILKAVIGRIPAEPSSAAHQALDTAIITPREHWPEQTMRDLAPILGARA